MWDIMIISVTFGNILVFMNSFIIHSASSDTDHSCLSFHVVFLSALPSTPTAGAGDAVKKMDLDSNCLLLTPRGDEQNLCKCAAEKSKGVCCNKGVQVPPYSFIMICSPHSIAQQKRQESSKGRDPPYTLLSLAHQNVVPLTEGMRSTTPRSVTFYTDII